MRCLDHALALGGRYSLDELGDAFKVLGAWYANAHGALSAAQKHLASKKLKAPVVRCWPHHFDLDTLVELGARPHHGLGYCPGDEFCDEPYFYTSMYPEPSIPKLPLLPAMAHWHTYKFLAALAPAHKIVAAHDQGDYVRQFLDVSARRRSTRCAERRRGGWVAEAGRSADHGHRSRCSHDSLPVSQPAPWRLGQQQLADIGVLAALDHAHAGRRRGGRAGAVAVASCRRRRWRRPVQSRCRRCERSSR